MAELQKQARFRETRQSPVKWAIIIVLPFVIFVASLFMGRYSVTPREVVQIFANYFFGANFTPTWEASAAKVIIQVRFPRAVMAALVGAGLSSSGASFQGMFQNPLVSPYTMGVSNGASFGASIAIVFAAKLEFLNLGDYLTPVFAFAFAAITMFLVQATG